MRIALLNWRDPGSPRAGGAEYLTQEVARGLADAGHEVLWVASFFDGAREREERDGVQIVRRGSELTVRFHAPPIVRRFRPDVIVEEINTLPWFAHAWAGVPTLLFINQLAREVWWYEAARPLAALGYAVEPAYLAAYRKVDAVTISASTCEDLRRLGHRAGITVLPMACWLPAVATLDEKPPGARLAIVGRLTPSKRVDHAVRAVAALRERRPEATLVVVGDGRERDRLAALARELHVADAVDFAGRVDDEEKARHLRESHLLVATAAREGWGLTVTEAARQGTPTVAYRVPGLRDSVVDGKTGVLTEERPEALARAADALLDDRARYEAMRRTAHARAAQLSFDETRTAFLAAVERVAGSAGP